MGYVDLTLNVPPLYLFGIRNESETYTMTVKLLLEPKVDPLRCPDNSAIYQLVYAAGDGNVFDAICGVSVTMANWQSLRLPIKATRDQLVDGDQEIDVFVKGTLMEGTNILLDNTLQSLVRII